MAQPESMAPDREPAAIRPVRRLVVNADDFGRSRAINAAVIQAHTRGILTTASLMVNEPAFEEAVAIAQEHPTLGVGLHLSLVCGRSALPPDRIPGLVDRTGSFSNNAARAGFLYFFDRQLHAQIAAELNAQIERFRSTGLVLDHLNGHLHLHLHPTVFRLLLAGPHAGYLQRMRLTRDPLILNLKIAHGRLVYRLLHAGVFHFLARRARPELLQRGIRHTNRVFGLLQNALVDEAYLRRLLAVLPEGDSELYSHPSLDEFRNEFEALVSPRVREDVESLGIKLIRYQDL